MVQGISAQRKIHLSLGTDQRAGDQVLSVRELSKSYGPQDLWKSIKFDIVRGERIGMIGPNGAGKTTLLEVLLGREDADAGNIKWGANLNIGYYDQRLDEFDPDSTVLDEAWGDRGGKRARVRLAQLLLDKPNVLVLDEPTNHLDIPSREALEAALAGFEGTILCVSHDRYFLDRVARRLLILDPPNLIDFADAYSAYVSKLAQDAQQRSAENQAKSKAKPMPSPKEAAAREARKKDNPYMRPFGRLALEELE